MASKRLGKGSSDPLFINGESNGRLLHLLEKYIARLGLRHLEAPKISQVWKAPLHYPPGQKPWGCGMVPPLWECTSPPQTTPQLPLQPPSPSFPALVQGLHTTSSPPPRSRGGLGERKAVERTGKYYPRVTLLANASGSKVTPHSQTLVSAMREQGGERGWCHGDMPLLAQLPPPPPREISGYGAVTHKYL